MTTGWLIPSRHYCGVDHLVWQAKYMTRSHTRLSTLNRTYLRGSEAHDSDFKAMY